VNSSVGVPVVPNVTPPTVSVNSRATDVDGTVRNTRCAPVALKIRFRVSDMSASSSRRSIADLSTPVTS